MLRINPPAYGVRVRYSDIGILHPSGVIEGSGDVLYTTHPPAAIRLARENGGVGFMTAGGGARSFTSFRINRGENREYRIHVVKAKLSLDSLHAFRDWAYERNIAMGSPAGIAWQMLRSTFNKPRVFCEDEHLIPLRFEINPPGGLTLSKPGFYSTLHTWDIRSAYLWAMAGMDVPSRFVSIRRPKYSSICDKPGFALISTRNGRQFVTISELSALRAVGEIARLQHVWIFASADKAFAPFAYLVTEGREISPFAKIVGNAMYGSFGARNERLAVRWSDGKRSKPISLGSSIPKSLVISRYIVGSLRARMRAEAWGDKTVQVNVDGAMILPGGVNPSEGDSIGDWRYVGPRNNVEILSHNWYAFDGTNGRTYRMAGISDPHRAARIFGQMRDRYLAENRSWMEVR
jgi:hypothetical protein